MVLRLRKKKVVTGEKKKLGQGSENAFKRKSCQEGNHVPDFELAKNPLTGERGESKKEVAERSQGLQGSVAKKGSPTF